MMTTLIAVDGAAIVVLVALLAVRRARSLHLDWGDARCLFWHRWIRRAWHPGWAAMGVGYGPREECTLCGRGWGTAWDGDVLA